jgi:hypothetical protein
VAEKVSYGLLLMRPISAAQGHMGTLDDGPKSEGSGEIFRLGQDCLLALSASLLLEHRITISLIRGLTEPALVGPMASANGGPAATAVKTMSSKNARRIFMCCLRQERLRKFNTAPPLILVESNDRVSTRQPPPPTPWSARLRSK